MNKPKMTDKIIMATRKKNGLELMPYPLKMRLNKRNLQSFTFCMEDSWMIIYLFFVINSGWSFSISDNLLIF